MVAGPDRLRVIVHSLSDRELCTLITETPLPVTNILADFSPSRNALSLAMLDSLHGALMARAADPQLRAIVIRGSGPVFCAGHDLKELVSNW